MIHQSNLYPMAVKTLTRVGGASIPVVPGTIMSAQTQGSGTLLRVRNPLGAIDNIVVTEAVGTVVADTCLFLVTPIVPFGSASSAKYIRADTVASFEEAPGGTLLILLSDDNGNDRGATLNVSEALATIQSRINTAIASIPESGTWGNLTAAGTTQGTATAITTNNVNITAGGSGRGVRLPAATVGMRVVIKDKTGSSKRVYPATGEFIDERLVNIPFDLPAYGQIELVCGVAGTWTTFRDTCLAAITGNGTTQGSATKIVAGVDVAVLSVSVGNTAVQLPAGSINGRIRVVNTSSTTARLFPATSEEIGSLGANNVLFVPPNTGVDLLFNDPALSAVWTVVSGTVTPTQYVSSIRPVTPTTAVAFSDGGTAIASFSTSLITLSAPLTLNAASVTAFPGGGQVGATQLSSNNTNIEVCATALDSVLLLSSMNFAWVTNSGVAAAAVYPEVGSSMDGTVNGFVTVQPGQSFFFRLVPGTTRWLSNVVTPGDQSGTANVGSSQATGTPIVNSAVNCTVCANAGDAFTIQAYTPRMFYFSNNGANAADVFPTSGGTINGGAADAAISVAAAAEYIFFSNDGVTWLAVLQ